MAGRASPDWREFRHHQPDAGAIGADTKKKTLHASEQSREDVAAARRAWRTLQASLNPEKLVFIDETGIKTDMTRLYGYAPRGHRLVAHAPQGHRKTSTFIAALRHAGMTAPFVLDGAMDGEMFLAYVQQFLVPTLHAGDIVIMDNLPVHKVSGVREAINNVGASVLHLPSYSPDFNPIELAFSKLKSILRKMALRTVDALWNALGSVTKWFTPDECKNFLHHDGYGSTTSLN